MLMPCSSAYRSICSIVPLPIPRAGVLMMRSKLIGILWAEQQLQIRENDPLLRRLW